MNITADTQDVEIIAGVKVITATLRGETGQLTTCTCHRDYTPANMLDAEGRCFWSKDHDEETMGTWITVLRSRETGREMADPDLPVEEIPTVVGGDDTDDATKVSRWKAFVRNRGADRAPVAVKGLELAPEKIDRLGTFFRTDLETKTLNCEEWCQHCGGRASQVPAVGIVMYVRPDLRLVPTTIRKGNVVSFQPVCARHLDEYSELPQV